MLMPKVSCQLIPLLPDLDDFGQPLFGASQKALCEVVKLSTSSEKTSIRTDASGTGGYAKEIMAAARLLFKPGVDIKLGDRVEINGVALRVIDVQYRYPRFVRKIDHLQVDFEIWV